MIMGVAKAHQAREGGLEGGDPAEQLLRLIVGHIGTTGAPVLGAARRTAQPKRAGRTHKAAHQPLRTAKWAPDLRCLPVVAVVANKPVGRGGLAQGGRQDVAQRAPAAVQAQPNGSLAHPDAGGEVGVRRLIDVAGDQ